MARAQENPHKSHGKLTAARSAKATAGYKLARDAYQEARRLERSGAASKTVAAMYRKAERLLRRVSRVGAHTEGPVGRLPNPYALVNDTARTCYYCGKAIKRGSLMIVSNSRVPYHRNCYKKAEREAARQLRGKNPASTRTSSDVRSPTKTSTSTYAKTTGNITVTGGAGAGATTKVVVRRNPGIRVAGGKIISVGDRVSFKGLKGVVKSWVVPPAGTVKVRIYFDDHSLQDVPPSQLRKLQARNPGFFGIEPGATTPQRVTKIRPVVDKATGEKGEIIGSAPDGYLKVKWHGRAKATLIKRSEIKRGSYGNPSPVEFAIWGIPPGRKDETLLVAMPGGKPITSKKEAERLKSVLEKQHGCRACRIQRIDGSVPDFAATLRTKKNPGLLEIAGGLQALDYLKKRKIPNPSALRTEIKETARGWAWAVYYDGKKVASGENATKIAAVRSMLQSAEKYDARRRSNPSVHAISQKFQGRFSNAVRELKAASSAPSDLARIGKLVLLKLKGRAAALRIPGAVVTADTREKLWIAGNRAPLLTTKAKPGTLLDFGEIDKIVYLTAKKHIGGGETYEYDHDFESPKPHLMIDAEGMPLIRGGGYQIKAAGITG